MMAEQISIFIENKEGRLAEVTAILRDAGVNIRALSLADTTDFGVLRLIVNDNDKATAALRNQGFTVGKTRVLAV
ncbi:MAG: ACT domain-containing protein, partial [Desulfobacter sp.]